ncbi:MAG TPA: hypothetical protein VFQ54_08040 [Thermomicrobiales bacterium]|nr:hypothetical protein [Thermomicrobiales bacterium]
MNVLGIGPPEVGIVLLISVFTLAPIVGFIMLFRRLGNILRETRAQGARLRTLQETIHPDVRRDDV